MESLHKNLNSQESLQNGENSRESQEAKIETQKFNDIQKRLSKFFVLTMLSVGNAFSQNVDSVAKEMKDSIDGELDNAIESYSENDSQNKIQFDEQIKEWEDYGDAGKETAELEQLKTAGEQQAEVVKNLDQEKKWPEVMSTKEKFLNLRISRLQEQGKDASKEIAELEQLTTLVKLSIEEAEQYDNIMSKINSLREQRENTIDKKEIFNIIREIRFIENGNKSLLEKAREIETLERVRESSREKSEEEQIKEWEGYKEKGDNITTLAREAGENMDSASNDRVELQKERDNFEKESNERREELKNADRNIIKERFLNLRIARIQEAGGDASKEIAELEQLKTAGE